MRTHPKPSYKIVLEGQDITPMFHPRLISLTLNEARGDEADQLDITLTDHDGQLNIPRKGVKLELSLGNQSQALIYKGTYIVNDVEHNGPPDVLTLRARSAELTSNLRNRTDKSWHNVTLGQIVKSIASANHLKSNVAATLANEHIDHIDQTGESDIAFITRLAKRFDAVATVKADTLLFLSINNTTTESGKTLPLLTIDRSQTSNHHFSDADRESYTGVKVGYTDTNQAQRLFVVCGVVDNAKVLPEVCSTKKEAQDTAKSEWQRIQRSKATLRLTLAVGMPELMPQTPIKVTGFKEKINASTWLALGVTHLLSQDAGLITSVEMESLSY